jgi:predicted TIM-barrel fold metal-dependent hydrolase
MSRPQLADARGPVRFVDAHVHYWERGAPELEWPMLEVGFRFPLHRFDQHGHYNAADHRVETAGVAVTKVVHVQAAETADPAAETRWLQGMADRDPAGWPNGIVGSGTLSAPDAPAVLERHAQYPNFRGVRDPSLAEHLDDPATDRALAVMAAQRTVCDAMVRLPHFTPFVALADRHPDVVFVLGHGGMPLQRTPEFLAQWRRGLTELARRDNIVCKVSGFGVGDNEWTPDSVKPLVFTCIETFGIDRCLFASNWPVDKLYSTYGELIATFDALTRDFSESDRDRLFAGTAEQVYRL